MGERSEPAPGGRTQANERSEPAPGGRTQPRDEGRVDAPTVQTTPAFRQATAGRRLLVCGGTTFATHTLPDAGDILIGRGQDADVRIDDPSVSRRHAVLHLGPPLSIEDLGSANGTRARGEPLQPNRAVDVQPGDAIDLGSVMVIVQPGVNAARPRRLWTHGYFEGRLEEECSRASRAASTFAVARIHVDPSCPAATAEAVLAAELGPTDLVAAYGPGEYEVLLLEDAGARADQTLRRIGAELERSGATIRTGVAFYPRDGRGPETLVAHACASVRGGRAAPDATGPVVIPSGAMERLHRLVDRVAVGTISVLLLGETGVGKEVLAAEIHRRSNRRDKPFVRIHCAALAESLLESELFGHEKGAFTGAVQAKVGLLESAQGGTVFLDEVGELPPPTQVKLLRVLEQREILRVGSVRAKPIDVRFVSATNRDLEEEVRRGAFREDLYFRLGGVSIAVPPLRERTAEIEKLARAFVAQACEELGRREPPTISEQAMGLLLRYSWPGNIRELRNVMERAVLLCSERAIGLEHLPVDKLTATLLASGRRPQAPPLTPPPAQGSHPGDAPPTTLRRPVTEDTLDESGTPLRAVVEAIERKKILEALEKCGGNQSRAAKLLGMPRRTLVSRLAQYDVPRPRGPRPPRD